MINPSYSIFIAVAEKDYRKLNYLLRSIYQNLEGYKDIVIASPDLRTRIAVPHEVQYLFDDLTFIKERDIFDVDKFECKYRSGWSYQMHLKMFQDVTKYDMYITIDADVIINKPISFFENDRIISYRGWDQEYVPYFVFQEKLFDLPRVWPYTGICDMNTCHKSIWKEFLERYGYTKESLWKKTCEINDKDCRMGEPEILVQYLYKFHRDKYIFKQLTTFSEGRVIQDPNHIAWTDEDYERCIERGKASGADLTMMHSWYG